MGLQIHLSLKHHEFLIQALLVKAEKVVLLEMLLERIVVDIVLLLPVPRPSVTDMAPLVPVTAVGIQFVISVEPLSTETAFRVASKPALVNGTGNVISVLFVLAQLRHGEEFMFVGEDFLVSSAKITTSPTSTNIRKPRLVWKKYIPHHLPMLTLDMTVQVWPSQARHITRILRAVVS